MFSMSLRPFDDALADRHEKAQIAFPAAAETIQDD